MVMSLASLSPGKGRKKKKKRLGRGGASGKGTTSGRGTKGQNARSGTGKTHRAFEGGQMPLARRIPKRGFNNPFRVARAQVNLETLNRFPENSEVGIRELKDAGLVKGRDRFKVLAKGELDRALVVKANAFSKMAKEKIEAAGGKAEVVD